MLLDQCESTNDLARELGRKGEPHGAWISARLQTAGRGRQGRHWDSASGNLFLSIVLRPSSPPKDWSWAPLAVGLAACRVLNREGVPAMLKWPNDLYIDGKKLGGILCEGGDFIVAGIGLNYASAPEDAGLRAPAISVAQLRSTSTEGLDALRLAIIAEVTALTRTLDPAAIRAEFLMRSHFKPGQTVQWSGKSGRFLGLGEFGEALVADDDGQPFAVFADDLV